MDYSKNGTALFGVHPDIDEAILSLSLHANNKNLHPASSGDSSYLLSECEAEAARNKFGKTVTKWFKIQEIDTLKSIRKDGRSMYRGEGITYPEYFDYVRELAGKIILITSTGCQLSTLWHQVSHEKEGRFLNLVEVNSTGESIRIVYGNHEFGTIPSIETHIHLEAHGMSVKDGQQKSVVVHTHPFSLVELGRHEFINMRQDMLNVALYVQTESLIRNHDEGIGFLDYHPSGSSNLAIKSLDLLYKHKAVHWSHHGLIVRSSTFERGYAKTEIIENAASSALNYLKYKSFLPLPDFVVLPFLKRNNLEIVFQEYMEYNKEK